MTAVEVLFYLDLTTSRSHSDLGVGGLEFRRLGVLLRQGAFFNAWNLLEITYLALCLYLLRI